MVLPAGASAAAAAPTRNYPTKATKGSRRTRIILLDLFALIVVAAAVVIPIYFLAIKKHTNSAAKASSNGTTASGKTVVGAVSGGDG
jgi:flagellar basal body-associated protein FliL